MKISKNITYIINKLNSQGYEAFLVGGCVRDSLLGLEPKDYDITTDAKPFEVKEVFKEDKVIATGEKYGTVTVFKDNESAEVTTYRIDGEYKEGRRPEEVIFSKTLKSDLERRDFTINAIAYSESEGYIDYFGGREDLKNKIIKAVGNPEERLEEDYLRILRAIRFSGQLDFQIEESLYKSIEKVAHNVENLSKERISQEFFKIMLLKKPSKTLQLMADTKVLNYVVPELVKTVGYDQKTPYHVKTLFDHLLCVVDNVEPLLDVRLAALFHDICKPETLTIDEEGIGHFYGHDKLGASEAERILKRLKASNKLIENVKLLTENHMKAHENIGDKGLRRQIRTLNENRIYKLYDLMIADRICTLENRDIDFLVKRRNRIKELIENQEVVDKSNLALRGNDLIEMGYKEGKKLGIILKDLLEVVTDDPSLNNKEDLKNIVRDRYKLD